MTNTLDQSLTFESDSFNDMSRSRVTRCRICRSLGNQIYNLHWLSSRKTVNCEQSVSTLSNAHKQLETITISYLNSIFKIITSHSFCFQIPFKKVSNVCYIITSLMHANIIVRRTSHFIHRHQRLQCKTVNQTWYKNHMALNTLNSRLVSWRWNLDQRSHLSLSHHHAIWKDRWNKIHRRYF